jgi:drug/metabolite transporter (DMT)-like permease
MLRIKLYDGQTPGMILTALANLAAAACVTVALTSIPIFEALVLWYLFPVWTMLLAARFLGDKISLSGLGFLALAVGGALIILWPEQKSAGSVLGLGHLAGLCSSFSIAAAFVLIRHYKRQSAAGHFFFFCLAASLLSCAMVGMQPGPMLPPPGAFAAISAVGLSGCASMVLVFRAVAFIPPAKVAILTMSEIVISATLAYFFFGESISARMLCGGLMIIGAGAGINMRKARTANDL